jgi:hypothetical protein
MQTYAYYYCLFSSMSQWPSVKAKRLLTSLFRSGWTIKRQTGSHRTLSHPVYPDFYLHYMILKK